MIGKMNGIQARMGAVPGTDDSNSEEPFDSVDISNPVSAYFFLSDDAQDEILGKDKKKMKCLDCGHQFKGEIYDSCPECFGAMTEEVLSEKDESQWSREIA